MGGKNHPKTKKFYRLRKAAVKKQKGRCAYCGIKMVPRGLRKDGLSGDLVIPWTKGGRVTEGNIVAACRGCNGAKERWASPRPVVQSGDGMSWDELWKVVIVRESKPSCQSTVSLMKELRDDVEVYPKNGDFSGWNSQGVLLWNAGPSCSLFFPALSKRGIVFALLGRRAADYRSYINEDDSWVIETSHPSGRGRYEGIGRLRSARAFPGSRLFSTINTKLVELGHEPVDWRL